MTTIKKFFSSIKSLISTIFTGHAVIASTVAIISLISITVIGVLVIKEITLAKNAIASNTETSLEITTEEETTTEIETTTEEITIEHESTTEETTTEEITTEPETTTVLIPETVAIKDLNIAEDKEEFDPKQHANASTETATEPPTTATIVKKPTTPVATPAVSEVVKVVKGIDVSRWQSDIDWAKVKASGVEFAIIKAAGRSIGSDNSLYIDSKFEQNIQNALANGVQVGVYFFSQAMTVQEAREEASLMLEAIKGYKFTYPVVFDWETSNGYRTYNAGLSKAQMNTIASTFCDIIKAAGYTPMIYGNTWDMANRYNTDEIASKYKCWIARYSDKYKNTGVQYKVGDTLPAYDYSFQMWQYSSTGRVDGINGNVDLNVSFFSYSGSGVSTTPVKLNLKNSTINTTLGTSVNLLDGVTASNSAGLDVSSKVTYALTDANKNLISLESAISTAGSYTITYTIKDFTGVSKTATATLVVRTIPVITLLEDTITFYENEIDVDTLIKTILPQNFVSALSYESEDLSSSLVYSYDKNLEHIVKERLKIDIGTYTVTYAVTDKLGISNTKSLTFTIIKAPEIVTTESQTTENETTTPKS